MAKTKSKRIVFRVEEDEADSFRDLAGTLRQTKVATIRLAVSLLATLVDELSDGTRFVLRDKGGKEKEIIIPQIGGAKKRTRPSL